MISAQITATAFEKLKREAKCLKKTSGCTWTQALDQVAEQAGYLNWHRITLLAKQSAQIDPRLPPLHKNRLTWISSAGKIRQRIDSAKELSEALGHATIHYFREPCELATPDSPCLCQIDPFATAVQAGVRLDIGDKHDMWDYLFILDEPACDFYPYEKRIIAGLGSADHYPNEHLTVPGCQRGQLC